MSQPIKTLYLPKTMADWPWSRQINPLYKEVKRESDAWFHSFKAFNARSQHAFDKGDFALIASLAYPKASKERLRTGCDLMNLFFLIDEYTDVENASVVRQMVDIVIDALNNPHAPRPEGEILLGEVARQFWALAIRTATPSAQRHFVASFTAYLNAVVDQAADRDNNIIRTIESYLQIRKDTIGVGPSCVLVQLALNLPDHVFYHPVVVELTGYIAEMIALDNDIASYNKEQAHGDDRHNILTIAMHQLKSDLDGAVEWVASYHRDVAAKFLDGLKRVPSFGPEVDKHLKEYISGLANWPRANDCWNHECGRYFGDKGLEIQKTRCVPLLPKVLHDSNLKRENVMIPLVEL